MTSTPFLVGFGPATFSTSLTLMPLYRVVYDTNQYYRDLGVSTYATRREIREAYQKKRGWRSARLTYIMKQLLDPEIRAKYDSTPMGSFFLDDYVEDQIRRKRMGEVVALREEGEHDLAELLKDMPYDWLDDLESPWSCSIVPDSDWPWAYYRWNSVSQDVDTLREWQHLLIDALQGGDSRELSVGFVGHAPYDVTVVGYRLVAFIGDMEIPTEALAEAVASRVKNITNT